MCGDVDCVDDFGFVCFIVVDEGLDFGVVGWFEVVVFEVVGKVCLVD